MNQFVTSLDLDMLALLAELEPNAHVTSEITSVSTSMTVLETKPTETKTKPEKGLGGAIAQKCVNLLKSGLKPKQVVEELKRQDPNCKTTIACVYWYQSKMNKHGLR